SRTRNPGLWETTPSAYRGGSSCCLAEQPAVSFLFGDSLGLTGQQERANAPRPVWPRQASLLPIPARRGCRAICRPAGLWLWRGAARRLRELLALSSSKSL